MSYRHNIISARSKVGSPLLVSNELLLHSAAQALIFSMISRIGNFSRLKSNNPMPRSARLNSLIVFRNKMSLSRTLMDRAFCLKVRENSEDCFYSSIFYPRDKSCFQG